jgi:hypothetical protein
MYLVLEWVVGPNPSTGPPLHPLDPSDHFTCGKQDWSFVCQWAVAMITGDRWNPLLIHSVTSPLVNFLSLHLSFPSLPYIFCLCQHIVQNLILSNTLNYHLLLYVPPTLPPSTLRVCFCTYLAMFQRLKWKWFISLMTFTHPICNTHTECLLANETPLECLWALVGSMGLTARVWYHLLSSTEIPLCVIMRVSNSDELGSGTPGRGAVESHKTRL